MKYLGVLGRQPEISVAELSAQFYNVQWVSKELAEFSADSRPNIDRLGGVIKIAEELTISPADYLKSLDAGKITLGISDYSRRATKQVVMRKALELKNALREANRSARVVPNRERVISTAAALGNGLGRRDRHVEFILYNDKWYVSIGVQNINAYTRRDRMRPARDAKVGMLPPKLAQILINLCGVMPAGSRVLDPFCGTGVILQEARLMGYYVYGTDKNPKMIEYSKRNLKFLGAAQGDWTLEVGDATEHRWSGEISAVAAESYLGSPLSEIPSGVRLKNEQNVCGDILRGFLKNLGRQIRSGTPVVIAVPAWLRGNGEYEKLVKNLDEIRELEYNVEKSGAGELIYARPGQIVAREILILRKK
ncbi:MAG: DNA methyltransferase [Candidatus Saccharibacteria bacterium]|nr:DNA methyltransferase [Candidatus Saccharibacteria bacterium]